MFVTMATAISINDASLVMQTLTYKMYNLWAFLERFRKNKTITSTVKLCDLQKICTHWQNSVTK